MKTFLSLTSIEEAIDDFAEEIIYIENGCLKKKREWKKYKCVERPFHTADEVLGHIHTVSEVYEKVLVDLTAKLNELHGLNLSVEAWRPIVHMWLPHYIEAMYIKYLHVKKAMADYPCLYTNILAESSYIHPYYGYGCWMWSLKREDYNFQLYSHVAQFMGMEINRSVDIQPDYSNPITQKKGKIKERFFNAFSQRAETVIINPDQFDFTTSELWKIILKSNFKIGFFFSESKNTEIKEYDEKYRKNLKLECRKEDSEFIRLIREYIFSDIPTMYLEGFTQGMEALAAYQCKKIISTEEYPFHMAAMLMGKVKNGGGKLYTVMIAGDGNIWQGVPEARLDALISEVVYTNGWTDSSYTCELRKITNPRYWRARQNIQQTDKKCDILYLASATFAYCTLMENVNGIFSKEFMDDNLSMIESLADKKWRIRVRLFMDTGWELGERVRAMKKNVEIDDYSRRFIETVRESKLCVMDSFGTGWAEALAMNIPFVIVIPKYMEFFTEAGWRLVHKFQSVGMYYNDHKEAEKHISEIVDKVDLWWKEEERQKVVNQIALEYAWCAENAKKEWVDEFIKISRE